MFRRAMTNPIRDQWNQRYAVENYFYGTEPNDFLREQAGRIPAGEVLCLGEGEGRNAVFLAGLDREVTAVDLSDVGLDKVRGLAAHRGVTVTTVHADLADHAIEPGRWSAVVAIWCHLPAPLRRSVHRAAVAGLRPGGVFLLEAYTPAQLGFRTGGPPVRELLYTLEELREDLEGLDLVLAHEIEREVHEGTGHRGRSAVVQIVGVKPR